MLRHAARFLLFTLLATMAACQRSHAPALFFLDCLFFFYCISRFAPFVCL